MSIGLVYWIVWIIWAIFGGWNYWPSSPTGAKPFGGHILLLLLTFLIGWALFGFVIQGPWRWRP